MKENLQQGGLGKNVEKKLPNISELSGEQLELLRKAILYDKAIASGLLRRWFGEKRNEVVKDEQKMDIKQ